MSYLLHREVHDILHGLGEKRPLIETAKVVYWLLIKQMALLVFKSREIARFHNKRTITVKDVMYVLREHELTVIRLLSFFGRREEKHRNIWIRRSKEENEQLTIEGQTSSSKRKRVAEQSLDDTTDANAEETTVVSKTRNLSVIDDFEKEYLRMKRTRINSVYKKIVYAIMEIANLKGHLTNENLSISRETRQARLNDLTLNLTTRGYERFSMCRRKNFQQKEIADELLEQIHGVIPSNITYDESVRELFMFLAKETIATLVDRVFENRKRNETTDSSEEENKHAPILVREIITVSQTAWPPHLGDIRIPYEDDNLFFYNKLIFD